jgi:hypothetical protein
MKKTESTKKETRNTTTSEQKKDYIVSTPKAIVFRDLPQKESAGAEQPQGESIFDLKPLDMFENGADCMVCIVSKKADNASGELGCSNSTSNVLRIALGESTHDLAIYINRGLKNEQNASKKLLPANSGFCNLSVDGIGKIVRTSTDGNYGCMYTIKEKDAVKAYLIEIPLSSETSFEQMQKYVSGLFRTQFRGNFVVEEPYEKIA